MARPRRPRLRSALSVLVLVLVAVSAWVGVRAVLTQRHLQAARAELTTAREALLDQDVVTARAALGRAGTRTERAVALTSDPVWRLAASVPFYGSTPRTVRGLAGAADDLARDVLTQALDGVEGLDPARLRTADGAVDLSLLRTATPPVVTSAARAATVRSQVQALPAEDAAGPVARARDELAGQVEELADALDGAAAALTVAPVLLGEDRPRRYLFLVQQTAESRGTGGLFGGYLELVADGGRIRLQSSGSNRDLRNFPIPVPEGVPADFAERYGPFRAFELWQNVNLSPDLPVVAKVVQARWQAQGGQPLDGVGVVDAQALATVLAGSGTISLPDGRELAPADLERYLAVDQYAGVPLDKGQLARKDQLEDVAAVVGSRLTSGAGDTEQLLRGLVGAVRSGHLKLASEDPLLAPVLQEQGVDGGLPGGDAPLAYPVVYNDSEGKLDYFLDRAVTYTGEGCEGAERRTEVTVTLTNDAPPVEALPEYLTIRDDLGLRYVSNVNRTTLSLYGTRGAVLQRGRVDGVVTQPENPAGGTITVDDEAGLPVWSLVLDLPPGQPRTVVLELLEPTSPGQPRLPEQPLARPLTAESSLPVC